MSPSPKNDSTPPPKGSSPRSQKEIFGVKSAKSIFAAPPTYQHKVSMGAIWKAKGQGKDDRPVLRIVKSTCKKCGFVITSAGSFRCARCHLQGWWWDEKGQPLTYQQRSKL